MNAPILPDRIEHWPVAQLKPYARNAKTHDADQVAKIAASMAEFGWTVPVLVAADRELIAGHGRFPTHVICRGRHECRRGLRASRRSTDRGVPMVRPAPASWRKPDDRCGFCWHITPAQLRAAQAFPALGMKFRCSGGVQAMYRATPLDLLRGDRQAQLLLQRP